ncbi:MAG: DUF58 domain-containing protein [Comamonadaceae bacterium]|nr:DUF58 domain-containing protein [Pseudomonadota bacterium]MBS0610054.1 DUF58 domain-containing protein [Pseudomonadota bacterium]MDE2414015.1 DUF58 domain-containing protein [Comamonadaceae bacterium]
MPDTARPAAQAAPGAPAAAERLLQRLEWKVIRPLDGLLQGASRTLLRGCGIDLADLREYQPHDDVRHIDWNVTARLATPHVRVYTEDRDMTAWFLLDLSPSVDFGAPGQAKRDLAAGFVGVLARLLQRHGNRVGAVLHDGSAAMGQVLPARGGRRQVLQLLHALIHNAPPPSFAAPPGVTDLRRLLAGAQGLLRRRSAVFVVSDFLSTPGWDKPLARLARRHDVVAVRLLDPLELTLPDMGLLLLRDPETGEQLQVDTHARGFRHRFARLAAQREAELRESLSRAGVDTLELSTDDDLLAALLRFMELRGHHPRTAATQPALAARRG